MCVNQRKKGPVEEIFKENMYNLADKVELKGTIIVLLYNDHIIIRHEMLTCFAYLCFSKKQILCNKVML